MARSNNTAKKVVEQVVEETKVEVAAEVVAVVTFPTTEEMVKMGLTTKSSRIRHLHSLGMKTGPIAKQECNGLYQHAFNVINKPLKTGKARDEASKATQTESESVEAQQEEPASVEVTTPVEEAVTE